jgi:hypothetical protein
LLFEPARQALDGLATSLSTDLPTKSGDNLLRPQSGRRKYWTTRPAFALARAFKGADQKISKALKDPPHRALSNAYSAYQQNYPQTSWTTKNHPKKPF